MEQNSGDYPQAAIPSPYLSYADAQPEPPVAQPCPPQYPAGLDVRPSCYSASWKATSECGPSIAALSPTYPYYQGHSPYGSSKIAPNYQHGVVPRTPTGPPPTPSSTGSGQHAKRVYSFVSIRGSQKRKRPRRHRTEIERIYECDWDGCEKAYGTLGHLNTHITTQSHGPTRTTDESKKILEEWKQRKAEAKKESQRAAHNAAAATAAAAIQPGQPEPLAADATQPPASYGGSRALQLPLIGYQAGAYPAPPTATVPQQLIADYPNHQVYANDSPPQPPYDLPGQNLHGQSSGAQSPSH